MKLLSHHPKVWVQTRPRSVFALIIRTESAIQSGTAQRAQMTPTAGLRRAPIPPRAKSQKKPTP